MAKTKSLLKEARDKHLQAKEIVMELLTSPMTEEQKELILKLYRLIK
jgi:hypothetical protein